MVSALPAFSLAEISQDVFQKEQLKFLSEIEYVNMVTLNLNIDQPCKNIGSFLTPSSLIEENEGIIGVLAMNIYD